jgi:basic amino acid/polyamine antiporter, APA family
MNLSQATLVGLGGIVGGGILALAGVALLSAGPSAVVAFALNAVIAIITALSFAELATSFPQSGGTYTYSKRVLSVSSAFAVGWVVWFASVVAGALYALGFAAYAVEAISAFRPEWASEGLERFLAVFSVLFYAMIETRFKGGGGGWETIGKMVIFIFLVLAGLVALIKAPSGTVASGMTPFFTGGAEGVFQAMGFTFIAFQGFDLIATVAGDVKEPSRNLPRAMVGSVVIATAIYLPLLIIVSTVGVEASSSITAMAEKHPETVFAVATQNYLGVAGYWLVVVAAILAMVSALQANLVAAAKMATVMATDRTLPRQFRDSGRALTLTVSTMVIFLLLIPDVGAAGAAAGLIFLLSFTLVHWICILARRRGGMDTPGFKVPGFPALPVAGALTCLGLALFQGYAVPAAGVTAAVWLVLGAGLFMTLLENRAVVADAAQEAMEPGMIKLRGRTPLVMVPVANPEMASALLAVAHAITPTGAGRVVLMSVVSEGEKQVESTKELIGLTLRLSLDHGLKPEVLLTLADNPWEEIARACTDHRCESLLLGFGNLNAEGQSRDLSGLIRKVKCDVIVVRAPRGWRLSSTGSVLVPVAGRGRNDALRARLLTSIAREDQKCIKYLRLLKPDATEAECRQAEAALKQLGEDEAPHEVEALAKPCDSVIDGLVEEAKKSDLLVLGLTTSDDVVGGIVQEVARLCETPIIIIGHYR